MTSNDFKEIQFLRRLFIRPIRQRARKFLRRLRPSLPRELRESYRRLAEKV